MELFTVQRCQRSLAVRTLGSASANAGRCGLTLLAAAVSSAWAQTSPSTSGASTPATEVVIVTAQKRAEPAQTVPLSITALTASQLSDAGITGASQLDQVAAGLTVSAPSQGQLNLTMRGIANLGGGLLSGPAVGFYLDETPLSAFSQLMPQLAFWDAERVEVLRGPQGTLFGEGSMGGTVRVISAKPDARALSGRALVSGSKLAGGDQGYAMRGVVNVPLIKDTLALRATVSREDLIGSVDVPDLNLKDTDKGRQTDARVALRWTPSKALTADLSYSHQSLDVNNGWATAPGVFQPRALDPAMQAVYELSPRSSSFDQASLTVSYDLGTATLVGAASWFKQDRRLRDDYTPITTKFFGPAGTGGTATQSARGINVDVQTQELRLVSNGERSLNWTVGAYHKDDERLQDQSGFTISLPLFGLLNDQSLTTVRARAKAWAVFGDLDFRLSPTLSLQAGARHYSSDNTQLIRFDTTSAIFGTVAGTERPSSGSASATSPKLGLRWQPSRTLMVYTRIAEGFRDGGSNYQAPGYSEIVGSYGPEKIRAVELGFKSQPLSWLTVNASLYRNAWTDLQLAFLTNDALFNFIQNAGKAVANGGEIELAARPIQGLRLGLNLAYVDAKIDEDVFNALGLKVATKGNEIPFSPKLQTSVSAAYQFALTSSLGGIVAANLSHRAATYSTADNDPAMRNGSADLLNLRFGVNADRWSAGLFINNVGNRRASTSRSLFPGATATQATFLPPRTVGLELTAEF